MDKIAKILMEEFHLKEFQIMNTLKLMDEGNTVPFIARYRKEATGELSDEVLRELSRRLEVLRNIEAKKEDFIFLFTQKLMAKDVFHGSIFVSNEINNVYVLKDNVDVSYIHYEEDEIQDILWMDTKELLCNLQNANKKFCISLEEYEKVLKSIKKP